MNRVSRIDAVKALPDASSMPGPTVLAVYHSVTAITDSWVSAYLHQSSTSSTST